MEEVGDMGSRIEIGCRVWFHCWFRYTTTMSHPQKNPSYESSTQFNNWRFSPERLQIVRGNLNVAAVAAIRNTFDADEVYLFLGHLSQP